MQLNDLIQSCKVDHLGIVVPDIERAAAFYRDVLGFEVGQPRELQGQGIAVTFVDFANTRVELLMPTTPESPLGDLLEEHTVNHFLQRVPGWVASRVLRRAGLRRRAGPGADGPAQAARQREADPGRQRAADRLCRPKVHRWGARRAQGQRLMPAAASVAAHDAHDRHRNEGPEGPGGSMQPLRRGLSEAAAR